MITKQEFKDIILQKLQERGAILKWIQVVVRDDSRYKNFYNAFIYCKHSYSNSLLSISENKRLGYYNAKLECYDDDKEILDEYWNGVIDTFIWEAKRVRTPYKCVQYIKSEV